MENKEIWQHLVEGIRSYCRDNGFLKAALGLSGGLDSAITAVAAAEALGGGNVDAFMLKTCYTSDLSLKIAAETAGLNGIHYHEADIQPLVEREADFLENLFAEKLKAAAFENLQARTRGKILMAYANQSGALLLSCGNKSEILTGYCTLYGDTCGGLAPLAGIYKSDLFALARWLNGRQKVLPPEVIERAPSAELAAGQKDEDSLPPYELLDAVLRLYVDEMLPAAEIIRRLGNDVPVEKIVALYEKSAFKRLQLPPAVKVQYEQKQVTGEEK